MQNARKWLIAALILSIAVNLALGGFVTARMLEPRMGPPRMDPALAFFPALRELPEQRRAELRPMLRMHLRHARANMRTMREAQRAIHDSLTAEPFSETALSEALATFRQALLASQEGSHAALIRLAQALTPAERLTLASAMRRAPGPPLHGGGGRMQPPPPPDQPSP